MMKRLIYLTAIILTLFSLTACSDSSSDNGDVGYVELDFDTTYSLGGNIKEYNIAGENCGADDSCICIYISEEIDGVTYTGFAVWKPANDFKIKIYSSDGGSTYSVNLKYGATSASCSINSGSLFSYGPSEDTSGFMTATFINSEICSSGYFYGSNNIVAPIY